MWTVRAENHLGRHGPTAGAGAAGIFEDCCATAGGTILLYRLRCLVARMLHYPVSGTSCAGSRAR
jgi:hypothetical protein